MFYSIFSPRLASVCAKSRFSLIPAVTAESKPCSDATFAKQQVRDVGVSKSCIYGPLCCFINREVDVSLKDVSRKDVSRKDVFSRNDSDIPVSEKKNL